MIFVLDGGNVFSCFNQYYPAFCMKAIVLPAFVKIVKFSSYMLGRVLLAMLVCEIIT